ncbi:MAG TPA: glycosyltransferase [Gaiellaceae bacterium]|nr:glycosyltransferase [Gaiellaceae bacterium]
MADGLRILFAAPAWWPATAFGGPAVVGRELTTRLAARGHSVEVLTTSLTAVDRPGSARTRVEERDGARVHYLATPARYRWMGITPTLPAELWRAGRPDVVHVFGFRDPVTTSAATWARARRIPYVFEPLGMYRPRLRKVALKQTLDSTLFRGVPSGAAAVVVASSIERDDVLAGGLVPPDRVHVRGNGFPEPYETPPAERATLGIPADAPVILFVGRIAAGKGIEHLVAALHELPDAHLLLVGPDDRHGVAAGLDGDRVHVLGPTDGAPLALYRLADVFVLPSAGESFGMVAAEAAAGGTPVVVTDRCGIAGFFEDGEALVVPDERGAILDAVRRVLAEPELRARLQTGGIAAARRLSWDAVTDRQEELYRLAVASRTAASRFSIDGS